jgi:prevent-host-death family protein
MNQTSRFLPVTEAKNRLLHLIREIDEKDEILIITRGGVPVAVMLSSERYEGLLETIEVLADRAAMQSLARSIEDRQAGRWVSEENDVFGKDQA